MQIGSLTLALNAVTIPILIMLVLSLIEVVRTWGVTTRPLAIAIAALVVLQALWALGLLGLPGSAGAFGELNVWLAIADAAIIPLSIALAYMAVGRRTVPIAGAIGLVAFLHFLIVTGIVDVSGLI